MDKATKPAIDKYKPETGKIRHFHVDGYACDPMIAFRRHPPSGLAPRIHRVVMLSLSAVACLGFASVTPPRGPCEASSGIHASEDGFPRRLEVVTEDQSPVPFPKLQLEHLHGLENEYQLNQGKAIDSLRRDHPLLLTHEPDLSIFARCTRLRSPPDSRPIFFCWSLPRKLN